MGPLKYDLHIHSCLSPCAEREMAPSTIAGLCALNGAELIALTDHNSALNLPAMAACCRAYGLRLLPGIEVNTAEEVHLLCYFATVEAALEMGRLLYAHLPDFPYDPEIWGEQWVMDEEDRIVYKVDKLLTGAVDLDLYAAADACRALGGVPVPAHVDNDSYSVLSALGLWPEDGGFAAAELHIPAKKAGLEAAGLLPPGLETLTGSDAHVLLSLREDFPLLGPDSVLWPLVEQLPAPE